MSEYKRHEDLRRAIRDKSEKIRRARATRLNVHARAAAHDCSLRSSDVVEGAIEQAAAVAILARCPSARARLRVCSRTRNTAFKNDMASLFLQNTFCAQTTSSPPPLQLESARQQLYTHTLANSVGTWEK